MNPKNNKMIYIIGYIIQHSTKCAIVQKILENNSQTFSNFKMIFKSDNLESLLTNNKLNPYKK